MSESLVLVENHLYGFYSNNSIIAKQRTLVCQWSFIWSLLVVALVLSRLDYGNITLIGVPAPSSAVGDERCSKIDHWLAAF